MFDLLDYHQELRVVVELFEVEVVGVLGFLALDVDRLQHLDQLVENLVQVLNRLRLDLFPDVVRFGTSSGNFEVGAWHDRAVGVLAVVLLLYMSVEGRVAQIVLATPAFEFSRFFIFLGSPFYFKIIIHIKFK